MTERWGGEPTEPIPGSQGARGGYPGYGQPAGGDPTQIQPAGAVPPDAAATTTGTASVAATG